MNIPLLEQTLVSCLGRCLRQREREGWGGGGGGGGGQTDIQGQRGRQTDRQREVKINNCAVSQQCNRLAKAFRTEYSHVYTYMHLEKKKLYKAAFRNAGLVCKLGSNS